jgi:hypothetical protein
MNQIFTYTNKVPGRNHFPKFLNDTGRTSKAVEIGVHKGKFAHTMTKQWKGHYYLVDPWMKYPGYTIFDHCDREADYQHVVQKFGDNPNVHIMRCMSMEAAILVPDALDFVYIDGNHTYDYVIDDICTWWPKVRHGGILAGHDIFRLKSLGVTNAVAAFCKSSALTCELVPGVHSEMSWFIEKE